MIKYELFLFRVGIVLLINSGVGFNVYFCDPNITWVIGLVCTDICSLNNFKS